MNCQAGSGAVLQVIYLVFSKGYYASSGESVTRVDLSSEAIRLGRLLHVLLPDSEVTGLPGAHAAARIPPTGPHFIEKEILIFWKIRIDRFGIAI